MIEWIKYDPANPPAKDTPFIVRSEHGWYDIAEVVQDEEDGYVWVDAHFYHPLADITHYAPINPPGEDAAQESDSM